MPGPQEVFYVLCGCVAVCREDRAAADRTDSRTAVSPGRAPDRLKPEEEQGQIRKKKTRNAG